MVIETAFVEENEMNKKYTFVAVLLLLALVFGLVPAAPVAAVSGDWVQFVSDVTIPDGTSFKAGDAFNKTWRLKNIGSTTWSTDYSLVFVSGEQMSAPASLKLPKSVAPGGTVDLTVSMTAPNAAGTYRGNWQLKTAGGVLFGIGAAANKPFWVEIKVAGSSDTGETGYDFVAKAAEASWTSGAGALTFPGTDGDAKGFGKKVDSPKLENGSTETTPGLLVAPQNTYNGYIQAQFPAFKVQSGDRFQSIINCEYNATSCYVNFRLNYQIGTGAVQTFWSFNERYEGLFYRANLDLSSLAGQEVKFILYVGAAGYATGDRALWGSPRITRGGGTPPTTVPTVTGTPPTPTATSTPKPDSSTCRAAFISDVNVPDGTSFGPSTAFTKTWRIKNVGPCTWTTSYSLVYISGEKMGGVDVPLKSTVAPNTSFEVSVNLTSPAANGTYRGYWQLKDDKGRVFGLGTNGDKPWWVEIAVKNGATPVPGTVVPSSTPGPSTGVFDFAPLAAEAAWSSGAGTLPFPGGDGDVKGFAIKLESVKLETGATVTQPTLLTVPQNVTDGFIQGVFPAFTVQGGDRFQATIGCQDAATTCYVTYRLDYQIGNGAVSTFWAFRERYEGLTYNVNLDLSSLAGQNVKFILTVLASGSPAGDRAVWVAPRITRPGSAPAVTATQIQATVTPTVTATQVPATVTPTATQAAPTATGTATVTATPG
jgi:hypothetical protein